MIEKQLNIFGEEIALNEMIDNDVPKKNQSLKKGFREKNGYNRGNFCGNCKYFITCEMNTTRFYKCKKIGITNNTTSNISSSDIACNLFEKEV